MTTATQPWTSSITEVAGSNVEVVAGGSGPPLIILHDELGHPGWLRYHEALNVARQAGTKATAETTVASDVCKPAKPAPRRSRRARAA